MCTVTLIFKENNDFLLTSNRDEAPRRKSLPPQFYEINKTKVLFPKDELSGGTWIGVSENKRLICLLNGGFECHVRKLNYRLSRGVVVNDLIVVHDIEAAVATYNLEGVEPFTMVIVDWNMGLKPYELVWDGVKKHFKSLAKEPKIWSSSTLYNKTMKFQRLQWFEAFKRKAKWGSKAVLEFHKTAGRNHRDYGVVMDRGFVKTTSMTQVEKSSSKVSMRYENFIDGEMVLKVFDTKEVVNG